MCGIAGVVSITGRMIDGEVRVQRMLDRLVHRGPDEAGLYASPSRRAWLGHRRLRIIDLSTGQQPMRNDDGNVVVAFNGEIYGFRELREQLADRGRRLRTTSDTEVIVHLYEELGARCLDHLHGMFALAVWDERQGTLLLARDRMGKKPLYYSVQDGEMLFASELHALAAVLRTRTLDDVALDCYVTFGYIPAPRTIFREVRKLEAGQSLLLHHGTIQTRPYWRLGDHLAPTDPAMEYADAQAELIRRLRDATARRMISDVPIGCFLSGGVDSTAVLAMMAELTSQPVRTFSIGFPEQRYSELPYARTIARHFGTDHHEYVLEPNAVEILDRLVSHLGEPFADSSSLATWYLSELTRKSVVVALTGDGGDELFGGYGWYRTGRLLNSLAWLPRPALRAAALANRPGSPRLLRRLGKTAHFLAASPGGRYAALREIAPASVKRILYRPEAARRIDGQGLAWLASHYDGLDTVEDDLNRMMAADLQSYMAEDLLVKVDRMSMAHSLECRSPLLDTELVTWALRIPSHYKLSRSWAGSRRAEPNPGKRILRDALASRVPSGVFDRPKQGFTVPISHWFKKGLKPLIHERVLQGPLNRWEPFDPSGIARLVQEHDMGRADHGAVLWALLVLGTWADQYLA